MLAFTHRCLCIDTVLQTRVSSACCGACLKRKLHCHAARTVVPTRQTGHQAATSAVTSATTCVPNK